MPARPCCTLPSAARDRNTGLTKRRIVGHEGPADVQEMTRSSSLRSLARANQRVDQHRSVPCLLPPRNEIPSFDSARHNGC